VKRLIKFGSIGFVIAGAIATGGQASAQLVVDKDANGAIYAGGLPASTSTELVFSGITQNRSVVANSCGAISLRGSSRSPLPATLTVGGSSIDISSLPVQLKPTCIAGAWNVTPTTNFRTSSGEVIIIGQTPNSAIQTSFAGSTVRRANTNACGFAKISSSGSFTPSGEFTITGQSGTFDVSSLTTKANPDICRNGVLYRAVVTPPPIGGVI